MIEAEGFTFDSATRDWTKRVTYQARTEQEALDWIKFNRDWMKGLAIVAAGAGAAATRDVRGERGQAGALHGLLRGAIK